MSGLDSRWWVMVLAHLLLAWSWIASQSRRFFSLRTVRARINYLLNLSLFAAVTAVIYSGALISQKAIPALTRTRAAKDMDWRWDNLHNQFSAAVLMLVGFHLAINWEWVLAAGQKIFRRFSGRRTMRFIRVLSRLALLSLVAVAFASLTGMYVGSVRSFLPDSQWRAGRDHRSSAPDVRLFPEFVGEGMIVVIFAVGGHIVFRRRLSPPSRSEGQPTLLRLHQEAKTAKS